MRWPWQQEHLLEVHSHGSLEPPFGCTVLVSVGAGVRGPVALWAAEDDAPQLVASETGAGGATFPLTRARVPVPVGLAEYADGSTTPTSVTALPALDLTHPFVQRLPGGRWLVVGGRCRWREEGAEQNALVIDPAGNVTGRGCLGDGIAQLQVAQDGTIWAGYFDEGVFGNFGWGHPGPEPLGAGGIAAWSETLSKRWELDPVEGLVADCYALNVAADAVWACPYTDFPVVRISEFREHVYATPNDVSGPRGVVVADGTIGVLGSYKKPGVLITGTLRGDQFTPTGRHVLNLPGGAPLPWADLHCRGAVAHFFLGSNWYSFDLAKLL